MLDLIGFSDPDISNNVATDVDSLTALIFSGGFEAGDTSGWTVTLPDRDEGPLQRGDE